ncbi:MAG: hypothetical protein WKF73_08645 [Nocardioidaceae bacterium]
MRPTVKAVRAAGSLSARAACQRRVSSAKLRMMWWPCSVHTDSGWNCTPHIG